MHTCVQALRGWGGRWLSNREKWALCCLIIRGQISNSYNRTQDLLVIVHLVGEKSLNIGPRGMATCKYRGFHWSFHPWRSLASSLYEPPLPVHNGRCLSVCLSWYLSLCMTTYMTARARSHALLHATKGYAGTHMSKWKHISKPLRKDRCIWRLSLQKLPSSDN